MYMNLQISATREVTVNKTGAQSFQTVFFDLFQVPTEVTEQILSQDDKFEAYKTWALSFSKDNPVSTYDPFVVHITELYNWISKCEENGYDIIWEMI